MTFSPRAMWRMEDETRTLADLREEAVEHQMAYERRRSRVQLHEANSPTKLAAPARDARIALQCEDEVVRGGR